jgi:hypothetical protein
VDHQEKLLIERKVWEKRMLEFESSGTSVAEFAKAHGFSVHQFYYWKNKFLKPKTLPAATAPGAKSHNLIKVITAKDKKPTLPDPVWLASFIKALHEVH